MPDQEYRPRHRADVPVDYIRRYAPAPPPAARVLTHDEFTDMWKPEYIDRMLKDATRDGLVEVDNPMRPEFRPRRGTER